MTNGIIIFELCYCFKTQIVASLLLCSFYFCHVLEFDLSGHKILFEDKQSNIKQIVFDGNPFIINSMQQLDCVHGKDWNLSQKKKRKEQLDVCFQNDFDYLAGFFFFIIIILLLFLLLLQVINYL